MSDINFKHKPNKNHANRYFKHANFSIMDISSEKFPEMVKIVLGPKWGKSILGKQYVNPKFAVKAIDFLQIEHRILSMSSDDTKELAEIGLGVEINF